MKNKFLILAIIFLFINIVLAQKIEKQGSNQKGQTVKGKITPYNGEKFEISLVEEQGKVSHCFNEQEIDKKGYFNFKNIDNGNYNVIITKKNKKSFFMPKTKSIRITLSKDTKDKEIEFELIKGGGLQISAELFNEENIENGMTVYGICNENKDKTFSLFEDDCLKSKNKLNFYGIKTGKYDIYVNISGFGVKQIKDVEIKEGELSKTEVNFNKKSKCGVEGKLKNEIGNEYKLTYSVVELIKKGTNNKLSTISFGNAVVDKKGNFKIIDMQPGTYRLIVEFIIKSTEEEYRYRMNRQFVKLKENKITKEILVIKKL